MGHVLGVDGGGTKTNCILMDETGQVVSHGKAGPSNYQTVGLSATQTALELAIGQAISRSSKPPVLIRGLGLGMAGVSRLEDIQALEGVVERIQTAPTFIDPSAIKWNLTSETLQIGSDNLAALVGGLAEDVGIVAIAGTGSQVFGRNSYGRTKRVGGWGHRIGDEGSGYDIAIQGLRAVMRAYDGRAQPTQLSAMFQAQLDLPTIESLIEVIYRQGRQVQAIAALATTVDQVAAEGDPVAQEIIAHAAKELALGVKVVASDLFTAGDPIKVVTQGGIWRGSGNLRQQFQTLVQQFVPQADILWPRHDPAYGAGLLALQKLGIQLI
ncbi:MAG: N-acetylglucosamine kinase [Microcoleaceae cyanobacterium]